MIRSRRSENLMSTRLYVGNLPYHATEDLISQHFATSGEVKAVNLMIDRMSGQSRGFCFVEMATEDAAQKAIADLNGKDFAGRSLRVDVAEERRPGGGGGGGGGGRGFGGGGRNSDRRGGGGRW
ncbi:MAG TPA: RNA-binding protein [Kofleriaceae bacterium]|nr:RNA-binding protein [Kofleriaceae bacterium]